MNIDTLISDYCLQPHWYLALPIILLSPLLAMLSSCYELFFKMFLVFSLMGIIFNED